MQQLTGKSWYWLARRRALRLRIFLRDLCTCPCKGCGSGEPHTSLLVCDHIIPHCGDQRLFWDESNLHRPCRGRVLRERGAVGKAGARFRAKEGAMSGDETASVNTALLQMAAKIGGLGSTVSTLLQTWQRQKEKASDGRKDLHQKVDALRADMTTMGAKLAMATQDIADMKPIVRAVQNVRARADGVRNVSRWFYWVAVGLSGGVVWAVTDFVYIHDAGAEVRYGAWCNRMFVRTKAFR
ncbi:DUF1515 family protein [Bradyrhizobium sp. ma5]|uniref:DUF1515 family protein n=1 Tax=Bradyrhizobium sp. ma5 TaxID=3344828 RepID=UPI0035D4F58C